MVSIDSPIVGPATGSLAAALDYAPADAADYIRELWRLAPIVGLDPAVLFAQWAHETDDGTSFWWTTRHNPAGIGITGDPAQNGASQVWANGVEAARGHVAHMIAYVKESSLTTPPPTELWTGDNGWAQEALSIAHPLTTYDDRWNHAANAMRLVQIRTIADLTGRWATDPQYGFKLVARYRAIFGEGTTVTARPRKPTIYDIRNDDDALRYGLAIAGTSRHSTLSERDYLLRRCFPNRNGATGMFALLHTQDGKTAGSLDWWVNGTDRFGNAIQASATVMLNRDGSLLQVIPEQHGPWTNGDVLNPTAQSAELRSMGGNPNLWTFSMEIDDQGDPAALLPDLMLESAVWWVYDLMERGKVEGLSRVLPHASINSVSRADCPGPKYQQIMSALRALPAPDSPVVDPQPEKPAVLGLPVGMSLALARRLFGAVETHGRTYAFNPRGSVSQEWLRRGIDSIPSGGDWSDGIWPALQEVVYRGKAGTGGRVFVFSDGSIVERTA